MIRRLLAFVLVVWEPLLLALTASSMLVSLWDRGWSAIALLVVRMAVAGLGVAAGRGISTDRPGAVTLARWATGLMLAVAAVTVTTSIWPSQLPPGVREPAAVATVAWYAAWFGLALRLKSDV